MMVAHCGFTNNYYIIYFVVNILWYMKTYQNQANELQSDVSKPKRFKIIILNIMEKLEDSLEICLKEWIFL